jgi:thiol-disulfide isomerase/thioredoxin
MKTKNMKKILTLVALIFVLQSFAQVRISGTVTNPGIDEVAIKGVNRFPIQKTKLEDGKFAFDIALERGYYLLGFGDQSSYIYVEADSDISVSVDYSNYEKTITFDGKGSEASKYLLERSKVFDEETKDLEGFYVEDPNEYKKNILRLKKRNEELLEKYEVSSGFRNDELVNLEYQYLFNLYQFSYLQEFYFEKVLEQPAAFVKELIDMNYDQEEAYKRYPYYRFLAEKKWEDDIAAQKTFLSMRLKWSQIRTRELKTMVLFDFYYKISKSEEKAESYYKLIKSIMGESSDFTEGARKEYEKVKDLQKGKPSPLFAYEDINGKEVSLTDLRGKYVYIDVWATWCKPCIAQMPDLKKLEADYHDKNIVFVSISVDKPKAKANWKAMVKKKELGGVQLIADNAFESEFIDTFGINSIPSFILIDPEGNIVERRSSKPSAQKIRNTFDALLKQ